MGVFIYFLNMVGEQGYARLALTHMLLVSGLVLAILVRPPTRRIEHAATEDDAAESNKTETSDDRHPTFLFLGILLLLMVIAPMGWTQWLIDLDKLRQIQDYFIIWLAVLAWVVAVKVMWRTLPPKPYRLNVWGNR